MDDQRSMGLGDERGATLVMRYLVVVAGLLLIVGGLGLVKYFQISSIITAAHAAEQAGAPPEAVTTAVSKQESWATTLQAVGSIAPDKGVTLSNDSSGIVARIHFESGQRVRAGQPLVELDYGIENAQLASARARQELAAAVARRSRALVSTDALPRSQLDNDEAALKSANADTQSLASQIARKVIRAPFSGRLGIRQINLEQFLSPGTPVVDLQTIDSVFVDFTLPQQQLGIVGLGMPVRVTLTGSDRPPLDGEIRAIDPTVDASTRSLKLRASVPNGDETLRPGMFTNVEVILPQKQQVVTVPATAIVHASYGDSVFFAEAPNTTPAPSASPAPSEAHPSQGPVAPTANGPGASRRSAKTARQQFVRVGQARGDFVAILDGVAPGQEVVTAGAFKLRNGMPIVVTDAVRLDPQLNPHPENR